MSRVARSTLRRGALGAGDGCHRRWERRFGPAGRAGVPRQLGANPRGAGRGGPGNAVWLWPGTDHRRVCSYAASPRLGGPARGAATPDLRGGCFELFLAAGAAFVDWRGSPRPSVSSTARTSRSSARCSLRSCGRSALLADGYGKVRGKACPALPSQSSTLLADDWRLATSHPSLPTAVKDQAEDDQGEAE